MLAKQSQGGLAKIKSAPQPNQRKAGNGQKNKRNNNKRGDSRVSAPIAQSQISEFRDPKINASRRSSRICHRELLGSVAGATAFSVASSYVLNPGMASTFPWLSTQACGWEQYRFHKLEFHYVPRCATTKVGSVLLAPDYDSSDAAPTSELIAASYRDSVEGSSWSMLQCKLHPGAMFPLGPRKFVRSSAVAYADYKAYDAGKLHVCVTEQDNTDNVGKLWVEYEVELFVPQNESSPPTLVQSSVARFYLGANQLMATTVAATVGIDATSFNGLGITLNAGVFTLPKGNYEVQAHYVGNDSASESLTVTGEILSGANVIAAGTQGPLTVASAGNLSLFLVGYVASDGSTTVRLRATLTGATGALLLIGTEDYTSVTIRMI